MATHSRAGDNPPQFEADSTSDKGSSSEAFESVRDSFVREATLERSSLKPSSKDKAPVESSDGLVAFPLLDFSGMAEASDSDIEEKNSGKVKAGSDFEYVQSPTVAEAKGGETLGQFAEAHLKQFLKESYDVLAKDPINLEHFSEGYKKSFAYINGMAEDAVLSEGQKVTIPGQNREGEPIYVEDGKVTTWLGDSKSIMQADGVKRTEWSDGRYIVSRPDLSSEERDIYGVIGNTTKQDDGSWLTKRSDGSYRIFNPDTGYEESLDANGLLVVSEKDKITTTYPNGEITESYLSEGRIVYTDKDKNITRTASDGKAEKFDSNDNLIGLGLYHGKFNIEFAKDGNVSKSSVTSYDRPEFNFSIAEYSDGRIELVENGEAKPTRFLDAESNPQLSEARSELLKGAEQSLEHPINLAKFKADMIRFENRVQERGLSQEEITESYRAVSRLFTDSETAPIDKKGRVQIASELMSNLAEPYTISQGSHGTCNVKILDVVMHAKHPIKAASLISEVALTGEYKLPDGKTVAIPSGTLKPHNDALTYPRLNGQRGYAGQIFDSTLINGLLQSENLNYRFDQLENTGNIPGYNSGDIMVDNKTNQPKLDPFSGQVVEFAGLSTRDIVKTYRLFMGESDAAKDWLIDPNVETRGGQSRDGVIGYETEDEFKSVLTRLKENGSFPFPIFVNTQMAPFWEDSGAGFAGGSGGAHVLNVTDFDPINGKVKIDNQWSTHRDRNSDSEAISLEQLYHASLRPDKLLLSFGKDIFSSSRLDEGGFDENIEALKILTKVLEGSDPSYLARPYNNLSGIFGEVLSKTEAGAPENQELKGLYKSLRPAGKLAVLDRAVLPTGLAGSFSEAEFNSEIVGLVDQFNLRHADVLRGLKYNPQTPEQLKEALIISDNDKDETMNEGKIDTIALIARVPEAHRDRLISFLASEQSKKRAEQLAFSRLYAE